MTAEDTIIVSEGEDSGGDDAQFLVSKLGRSKTIAKEDKPLREESTSEQSGDGFSPEMKLRVPELRKESAYLFERACVNFLVVLLYFGATIYLLIGVFSGLRLQGSMAAATFFERGFVGVVSIVAIYVVQSLIHIFIDMADMMLAKSGKEELAETKK